MHVHVNLLSEDVFRFFRDNAIFYQEGLLYSLEVFVDWLATYFEELGVFEDHAVVSGEHCVYWILQGQFDLFLSIFLIVFAVIFELKETQSLGVEIFIAIDKFYQVLFDAEKSTVLFHILYGSLY